MSAAQFCLMCGCGSVLLPPCARCRNSLAMARIRKRWDEVADKVLNPRIRVPAPERLQ